MKFILNKTYLTLLFIFLMIQSVFGQPANNACSGATTLPQNGSCLTGTTISATDTWIGTVGCAGNNAEVWYTFVSTGTQANIVVTSGTLGGNIELTLVQASGLCSGLSISGANCGPSVLNSTFNGIQVGVRYYVTISSTGTNGTFTICNTVTTPPPVPGQDCTTPAILCNNNSFSQGNFTGVGVAETISTNTCFGGQERQSRWYTFTVGCTGTFGFVIQPTTPTNDIDWVIINTTTGGCYSSGTIIKPASVACNWSGCPGATGIHTNPSSLPNANNTNGNGPGGCGGTYSAFTTTLPTLTAGNTYTLLIDNFSTTGNGFSVSFPQGTAIMGPSATFTSSLSADCYTLNVTKTCPTTNSTYLWNYGDGTISTLQNPPSKLYSTAGNYTVSLTVTDALGCIRTTSQVVTVGCVPLPIELISFGIEKSDMEKVNLIWETATEKNNDYFTLERSLDGENFYPIGIVNGAGNSTSNLSYRFVDLNPVIGTSYYRLKQTDFDGVESTSMIVSNNLKNIDNYTFEIHPNPSSEDSKTFIELSTKKEDLFLIEIMDMRGTAIFSNSFMVKNTTTIELPNNFNQGVYFVKTTNSMGEVITKKFIVN